MCIFDPEAGDLSNEKVLVRLKRDASRSKVLAAMRLPPMASWEWLPREGLAGELLERHGEPGPFVATRHRNLTRLPRLYSILHTSSLFSKYPGVSSIPNSRGTSTQRNYRTYLLIRKWWRFHLIVVPSDPQSKDPLTAVFHGLDARPDGLAHRCGRQPECRFSGRRHLRLHQWKRRHGSAWNVLPPDLAVHLARLLTSDVSAMIYKRLGAGKT